MFRALFDIDADRMQSVKHHLELAPADHDDDDTFEKVLHFLSAFVNATNVLEEEHHEALCREAAEDLDE